MKNCTTRKPTVGHLWLGLMLVLSFVTSGQAAGALQMRNGYFWDPTTADYFIARGIAYQTWNPPVGANQTFDQLEYDLVEFKKMYANSVRAEFVWNVVEYPQGVFDWTKPDYLVAKAEELGLKLFVLIGFQYAPDWFSNEWKAVNNQGSNSVVLAYENPNARHAYSNYIAKVTSRYKNSPAIGAWILGNEYAYFDLWDPARRFLGYDAYTVASFHAYLAAKYTNNLAAANATWGTTYSSFDTIPMPQTYPANRNQPIYHDLIQWRKNSIGQYVALGAQAARRADPNHLLTYSMVGGLFGEADVFYTCEDARTIVKSCAAAGAPLDFWSINNYAIATLDTELRSVDYGIGKHQAASGLPVLVTETGHTSTETLNADASARQAAALPTELWATLMSGALGVHIFTWNDRDFFSGNNSPREKGFGIVAQNRQVKSPVYENVVATFRRMAQIQLGRLLGGTTNPPADVQFFWSQASDMGWCRANHEIYRLWSTLKRLGYQPRIIHDEEFDSGAWAAAPALMLSRCFQMDPRHLDMIVSNVVTAGINLHANADLPGQFNAYHKINSRWAQDMSLLFGLNVTNASAPWDAGAASDDDLSHPQRLNFTGVRTLGPLPTGYSDSLGTWKIWQGLTVNSGLTIVTDTGLGGTNPPLPALHTKNLGAAKTAINTFALGDVTEVPGTVPPHTWDLRYQWLRAIYRDYFGLTPAIDLSGSGASYVYQNYRVCPNGSVLIGLLNGHTNSASVQLSATSLLAGKTVENLTTGGIVETNSDGLLNLNLAGDDYVLLYAYHASGGGDQSLLSSDPNKVWIQSAPLVVWPNGSNWDLTIGFDTRAANLNLFGSFERVQRKTYAQSAGAIVSGQGSAVISLLVPDADLNDPDYLSSPEGGQYVFHAWLQNDGTTVNEIFLPVRLVWGVRPLALPLTVVPGSTYPITVAWQELPSYLPSEGSSPLSRAALWEPWKASHQYYKVVLELWSAGQLLASQVCLTDTGTDQHTFSITVPGNAVGPFTWTACLQSAPGASMDLLDSFEDRDTGVGPELFAPWQSYVYSELTNAQYWAAGVDTNASDGRQAVFMIVTNPPNPGSFSGFLLEYSYPQAWSLPHDSRSWTNYAFSFDFREQSSQPCLLELQLKDTRGGLIHFTKTYTPGPNQWDTIRASLDQFAIPSYVGFFDSTKVINLVVNVQMLQAGAVYQSSIDNIRFQGPEIADPVTSPQEVWDSFDDRNAGADPALLAPWSSYVYAQNNNEVWLAQGINSQAANGGQAAFLVVTNPPNPGAYSGFGLYYAFSNEWALPADTSQWANFVFSYDFKESSGHHCALEMQIKSGEQNWIEFTKPYTPGPDGWDTVRASLDQFVHAAGVGPFDPNHVQALAVNIRVFDTGALYTGLFDNVFFNTPDQPVTVGTRYALYSSANDSLRIQNIGVDSGGRVTIVWPGNSLLQFAPNVTGPYTNVIGAASPFHIMPLGQGFYRLLQP